MSLDDLARARIGHRAAVAPAPRRPVYPLDDVVAHVERIGSGRHQLHAERIPVPGRLERLVPPARAIQQRRADRLRRPPVQVVDDRLDHLADRGRRVPLLQAMPAQVAAGHGLAERRRVVDEGDGAVARPWIVGPWGVPVVRQCDERLPLAHGDRIRTRRDRLDGAAAETGTVTAPVARKGQRGLHLGVLRKRPRSREVHRAALTVEPVGPRKPIDDAMDVAQQKRRGVDKEPVVRARGDREPEQDRRGERVFHRPVLVRVRRRGAVAVVRLHHQNLPAHPLEAHDARAAELPAVEPDVVRADARGQGIDVQHFRVKAADLEPKGSGVVVPVEREEAVQPLEAGRMRFDRRQAAVCLRIRRP